MPNVGHSKESICNAALGLLGKPPLVSDAEAEQEYGDARRVVQAYAQRIGRVLRSHPWDFAMRRAILPPDTATPKYGYSHQFTLPGEPPCARVWQLDRERHGDLPDFKVEGHKILINDAGPLYLSYIARITDPAEFTDDFAEALAAEVAAKAAVGVLGSLEAADSFRKEWQAEEAGARRTSGQQQLQDTIDGGTWLPGRRTG
jgi:hypothetical protein